MTLLTKPGFVKIMHYVNLSEILDEMESRGIDSDLVDFLKSEIESTSLHMMPCTRFVSRILSLTMQYLDTTDVGSFPIQDIMNEIRDVHHFSNIQINLYD